jgi:Lrp/AsnC family transcriptional regulator, leucine-responsive regulatory protein
MDQIDKSILTLLEKNARMSVSEISNTINLSVSAVSERIKKLENLDVIQQYTTIINPHFVNKNLIALMAIALDSPSMASHFLDFVQHEGEILECYYLAGEFDYQLKIVTENTDSLRDLLDRIKNIQGVGKTKTTVTLSTIKNKLN